MGVLIMKRDTNGGTQYLKNLSLFPDESPAFGLANFKSSSELLNMFCNKMGQKEPSPLTHFDSVRQGGLWI